MERNGQEGSHMVLLLGISLYHMRILVSSVVGKIMFYAQHQQGFLSR